MSKDIPSKTIELVDWLDKLYPDRMDIDDTKSDKEKYRLEGKVELIRLLKSKVETTDLKDK